MRTTNSNQPAQSDQGLRCPQEETLLSKMRPVKILIRSFAQSDLNDRWAHMSEGKFSNVGSHIFLLFHDVLKQNIIVRSLSSRAE